ncbi:hypothetical protein [Clostridium sp. CF012]|uniref:hypothetical protein n=1 Tax=Clostridium sp. CF012 TaxID=2843319 RepID=UPI001C0AFDCD|nr:hypothetical protein [Clostridium sp. CF012]MBU3145826.1 hypothetical protein [Clostridium sp. CF012]
MFPAFSSRLPDKRRKDVKDPRELLTTLDATAILLVIGMIKYSDEVDILIRLI